MQPNLDNDLITYKMTAEEQLGGSMLNTLQKAVIQNERVEITRQLANLSPSNMGQEGKESFWQQEAYLRGQLDILTHMLEKSSTVETSLSSFSPSSTSE